MEGEYLTRCIVDPVKRKFYLHSSEGTEKEVSCETTDQFMNVLKTVREKLNENMISYSNLL